MIRSSATGLVPFNIQSKQTLKSVLHSFTKKETIVFLFKFSMRQKRRISKRFRKTKSLLQGHLMSVRLSVIADEAEDYKNVPKWAQ